ncbi:MAG: glycoside hydrolase, partial [Clostridiaceae bacterium]|nr:glycoside hydrolase [Clostridiaceae bacterium]
EINKESDGKLRVLFLDYTMKSQAIKADGVFANLTFKIKSSAADDTVASISKLGSATFGDKDLNRLSVVIIDGSVKVGETTTPVTPTPTPSTETTPTPSTETTPTPSSGTTPTPVVTDFSIVIDSVNGNPGSSVVVPVKLAKIPSVGVSTADMAISYDSDILEYVSYEAGSIVKNPDTNLEINKESDGSLKVLFLDYTMKTQAIEEDGVFVNLNFNIKSSAQVGSKAELSFSKKPTFGDNELNPLKATAIEGNVNVVKKSSEKDFKFVIDTVSASKGQEAVVALTMTNVPEAGVSAPDLTLAYDADKLEFVSYEAGSIVTNPDTNLEINKEADGKLKVLFLDYTMKTQAIKEDGIFATLTFKVIGDEGMADVEVTKSTFGDNDLSRYEVTLENGGVNIGSAPEGFTISGYINPDFMTTSTTAPIVNEGFKVEIVEANKSVATDNKGYFEIKDIAAGTYTVKITKDNYLTRIIESVTVSDNKEMSTSAEPILMWAGDMIINGAQDGAINLEDIMEVCKAFNTASTDSKYKEDLDLNKDGAINLEDVMIIARHFNKVSSDY